MHDFVNLFNYFFAFILDILKHAFNSYFVYYHFKSFAFKNRCDYNVLNLKIIRFQYLFAFFKNYSENY